MIVSTSFQSVDPVGKKMLHFLNLRTNFRDRIQKKIWRVELRLDWDRSYLVPPRNTASGVRRNPHTLTLPLALGAEQALQLLDCPYQAMR